MDNCLVLTWGEVVKLDMSETPALARRPVFMLVCMEVSGISSAHVVPNKHAIVWESGADLENVKYE